MSEGIEFIVDIQERLEGAVAASTALKKLYADAEKADHGVQGLEGAMKHAGASSHAAGNAHGEHGHKIWQLGHQYEYAKNGVMEFTEAIGLVLAYEGIEALIDKVKELGAEILKAGASEERSNKAFEMFFGADKGRELLEYMDQFRKASEFNEDAVKGMMLQLGRAGFSAKELPRAMAAAGDIAARFPDKAEGMSSALMALGLLKTTGRIEARQFKALGLGKENAQEEFFAELSKRTGMGIEILKKKMEQGKIPIGDAIESLYTLIAGPDGKLGQAAVDMGKTMAAKLTHFHEIPELIFESVEKSPAFARFATFIGEMTEKLGPEGPLGSKLAAGLGKAFDDITGKLSKITPEDITGFVDALAAMPGVIADLTKALIQIMPYVSQFAGAIAKLSDSGSTISRIFQIGKLAANPLASGIGGLKTAYESSGAKNSPYVENFKTGVMDILTLGHIWDRMGGGSDQAVAKGLAKGLEYATPFVEKASSDLADSAVDAHKKKLGIQSPSRVFAKLGLQSAEGFAIGLEDGMDDAIDIPALSTSARAMIDGVQPQASAAGTTNSVSAPVTITINGGDASPQEIAEVVHVEVASAILAALEQMALQGGQA